MLLNGKWSYKYDKCKQCKKTEKKHHSHGVCLSCYFKNRYKNGKEYHQEFYRKYWQEHKEERAPRNRAYYLKNSEKIKKYMRDRYQRLKKK